MADAVDQPARHTTTRTTCTCTLPPHNQESQQPTMMETMKLTLILKFVHDSGMLVDLLAISASFKLGLQAFRAL